MDFNSCMPAQEVLLTMAINDMSSISILGCDDVKYDASCLEVSWSYDGINWSCFASYDDAERILVDSPSDFYIKFKVNGVVNDVKDDDEIVAVPELGELFLQYGFAFLAVQEFYFCAR